jgi:hypothetical protein
MSPARGNPRSSFPGIARAVAAGVLLFAGQLGSVSAQTTVFSTNFDGG